MKYAYPLIASSLVLLQTSLYAVKTTDATQDDSATKATAERREQFRLKMFDKNGDGKLDEQERATAKAQHEKMLKKFDTNGDGKLDAAERKARNQFFLARKAEKSASDNTDELCCGKSSNRVDTAVAAQPTTDTPAAKKDAKHLSKKDGTAKQDAVAKQEGKHKDAVAKQDRTAKRDGMAKLQGKQKDTVAKQEGKHKDAIQKVAKVPGPAILKAFDKNGDGTLSDDERAVLRQTRKTFDKDGNGKLSRTERQAMLASVSE